MPNFQVNNAGPGNVVIAAAVRGQRFKVTGFSLSLQDGNGLYFRSGITGNAISPSYQAGAGSVLTPDSAGGYKVFYTFPGEPLVLTITGSGTVTGEVIYDILPPGQ